MIAEPALRKLTVFHIMGGTQQRLIALVKRKYAMLTTIVTVDVDCTASTKQKLHTTAVGVVAALSAQWSDNRKYSLDDKRHLSTRF